MEENMRQLCDLVLAELRKRENMLLGGIVDRLLPIETEWGWESTNGMPSRFFEINITALKNFQILYAKNRKEGRSHSQTGI